MKKILSKIKTQLKNTGSTLVFVIVALGFVGILMGALLTAVGYAYRQKLYDYNEKSNFYYLEEAMDEIYAGIGAQTMNTMQEAYEETREEAVYYNTKTFEYQHMKNADANTLFKNKFMKKISKSDLFKIERVDNTDITSDVRTDLGLAKTLSDFITNKKDNGGTINLVANNLRVIYQFSDGTQSSSIVENDRDKLTKIIIKNVTLHREAVYNRSNVRGNFSQTISTDIEISRPDFDVSFDGSTSNVNNLFEFCIVSDSGVEINKQPGSILSMNGNVYAANDFYNKRYNDYLEEEDATYKSAVSWTRADGSTKEYPMNKVTSYSYNKGDTDPLENTTLLNKNDFLSTGIKKSSLYDGNNTKSKYSGFYINGSSVNIFANKVIVPGSIAVMDAGSLSIYGVEGTNVTQSNVWADELVLAGSTQGTPKYSAGTTVESITNEVGAKADLTANLYIKDDTQIESDYSRFRLNGAYYGYGNSTEKDTRTFIPTTLVVGDDDRNIYQEEYKETTSSGTTTGNKIRSHYNSSAFIVNGQHANVNLLDTKSIYIAGRSYIELSKINNGATKNSLITVTKEDGTVAGEKITSTSYTYDSDLKDYKTGESLSVKSSQLAYKPDKAPVAQYYTATTAGLISSSATEEEATTTDTSGNKNLKAGYIREYYSELPLALRDMVLFTKYFNTAYSDKGANVPVLYVEDEYIKEDGVTKAKKYLYYLDFQFAFDNSLYDTTKFTKTNEAGKIQIDSADDLTAYFITDYFNYVTYVDKYNTLGAAFVPSDIQDTDVLVNKNEVDISGTTVKRTEVLAQVTNYEDYFGGAIATTDNIYASGAVTTSLDKNQARLNKTSLKAALTSDKDVTFAIQTSTDQEISSTVLGADEDSISDKKVTNATSSLDFSKEYEKHYNYLKWSLQDLPTAVSTKTGVMTESQFVDEIVKQKGAESLTPLNNYFNFDTIQLKDADFSNGPTNITPTDLKLAYNTADNYSEYKVYVSNNDIELQCQSAKEKGSITGIVITKGDVYFKQYNGSESWKTVTDFNGIIISGGKVYVNNNITTISSSDLCKTIMNQCIVKAQDVTSTDPTKKREALMAVKVLELFKDYEDIGKEYREIYEDPTKAKDKSSEKYKNITNIDYSDVIRYNNWMRNVD